MPRFAMLIDYDGGPYNGWQRQAGGQPTVQARLEAALAALDPAAPFVQGAGRTDAGVHATGQVAHCDLAQDWDAFKLRGAINWHLRPDPIAVLAVARADDNFHARFSATERRYVYRLINRRAPLTVDRGRAWSVKYPLDVTAMRTAAAHLIGQHDFTTFRSLFCQAQSPVKTLDEITMSQHDYPGGSEVRIFLRARSFLHNQVRSIVGSLERVGAGAWSPDRMAAALAARDRTACGPVCPPDGLTLTGVEYPADPFAAPPPIRPEE
jgi:tRNA pseudouridine38-40 synthase